MQSFDPKELTKLYTPPSDSHKGMNGKLMIIGGSKLFHAASLWALMISSRLLDMVFYASVAENNQIVHELKKDFRNGIVVPRDDIGNYMQEADAVLIGPGMLRTEMSNEKPVNSLAEINALEDEGEQSHYLTKYLLEHYPEKKWVIDAGALQMMKPEWLEQLQGNVVVTPHQGEFERVFGSLGVAEVAKKYNCTVLLKGEKDIICSPERGVEVTGGNAGMTKGGTGDVLAGLVAALACKNDIFLATAAGSYINKKAGEALYEKVGFAYNASDLAEEIPHVMKELVWS